MIPENKDLVGLGPKGDKVTSGADIYREHFVGIVYLRKWVLWPDRIPKEDRAPVAAGYQRLAVAAALGHAEDGAVGD